MGGRAETLRDRQRGRPFRLGPVEIVSANQLHVGGVEAAAVERPYAFHPMKVVSNWPGIPAAIVAMAHRCNRRTQLDTSTTTNLSAMSQMSAEPFW
jgi:hypothetical protein